MKDLVVDSFVTATMHSSIAYYLFMTQHWMVGSIVGVMAFGTFGLAMFRMRKYREWRAFVKAVGSENEAYLRIHGE